MRNVWDCNIPFLQSLYKFTFLIFATATDNERVEEYRETLADNRFIVFFVLFFLSVLFRSEALK